MEYLPGLSHYAIPFDQSKSINLDGSEYIYNSLVGTVIIIIINVQVSEQRHLANG